MLPAQESLNFLESPQGGGVLVAQDTDAYAGTGSGSGKQYLFNGEAGDRLTVMVQTDVGGGSSPRIRLADGDDVEIVNVLGNSAGRVVLENRVLATPGTYRLNIHSDSVASGFVMQAMLGRNTMVETESNDLAMNADPMQVVVQPGGFEMSVAGVLEFNDDWYELGNLDSGNVVSASLQLPVGSSLAVAGVELALFRDGSPVTTVTGTFLNETISQSGDYRMQVRVPGVDGYHMRFNGGDDEVNLGDPAHLRMTGSQTIEFWVRPENFSVRRVAIAKAYGGEGEMTIETNGTVNYYYGTAGGNSTPHQSFNSVVPLRAGEWQHVALVRDLTSSPQKVYWFINGRKTAEAAALYIPAVASTLDFRLGRGHLGSGGAFIGEMDEVRLWSVARTAQEIADNMDNTLAGTESDLVGYYKFEENGGTTVTDSSLTVHGGTILGAPSWEGSASTSVADLATQGVQAAYLLEVNVTDEVNPVVGAFGPEPPSGWIYPGTTAAPSNMTSYRGNNDTEYFYTMLGSTGGSIWGTDLYTDDSALGRAAVHAGALADGEWGTVKVTVKPGAPSYQATTRNGVTSYGYGGYSGSYIIEPYEVPGPFDLTELYRFFLVQFSEPIDESTLAGAFEILGAGPDGLFGTGDDLEFTENYLSISAGNEARFDLDGTTLAPGLYRLTVAHAVADRAGNTMGTDYVEQFTVAAIEADGVTYVNESGQNEGRGTADRIGTDVTEGEIDGSFMNMGFTVASDDRPYDSEVADLDGDGNLDVVVAHLGNGDGVRLLAGNGDGTFEDQSIFPEGTGFQPWQASYYPSNGFTGTPVTRVDEVISFDWGYESPDPAIPVDNFSVRWTGAFIAPRTGNFKFRCNANESKKVWIDLNRNGTFEESEKVVDQSYGDHWSDPFDVTAGLSYDVKMDLIEYTGTTYAYLTVHESMTKLLGDTNDVVLFDLEGDGDLDIAAVVNPRDVVEIFRNDSTSGNFSFHHQATVAVGDSPRRIEAGDLTGDGLADLVVSNYETNATTGRCVSVLISDGAGGMSESKLGLLENPRVRAHGIALGDLDEDGDLDIIASDYDSGHRVVVWPGNGDGTFGIPDYYDYPTWSPVDMTVGDFDQDGHLDVVVARNSYGQEISIYPGNGDGTLGDRVDVLTGFGCYPSFIKTADLNGDAYPDLLVGANYGLAVMTNDANGGFEFTSVRWDYGETYGISAGDLNNDGRTDIVLPDYDNDLIRVLEGNAKVFPAADDSVAGLRHAYGRGVIKDGSDNDYWVFSAERGQTLTVAMDNSVIGGGDRRMRMIVYDDAGNTLQNVYIDRNYFADESPPLVIPRDGSYYVRFFNYVGYYGEYRFRVTLTPEGIPVETEDNSSIGGADVVALTPIPGQLEGTVAGYLATYEGNGDYFNLGNMTAGTVVAVDLTLPSTSTLTPVLHLYTVDGTEVTPGDATATHLNYTLPAGVSGNYIARVEAASGAGLMAEYVMDVTVTDAAPPSIVGDNLPAEGTAATWVSHSFTLNFSEDMAVGTVMDAANYELLASGGDGTFGDGNEVAYTISPDNYTIGLSASYTLPMSPLQPDSYRFTATTGLTDRQGNAITADYVRTWSVGNTGDVAGYTMEGLDNNSFDTASPVSAASVLPGEFDGSFVNSGLVTTTVDRPYDLESADLDGDGNRDAVAVYTGSGDGVRVLAGNGDGTFVDQSVFAEGTGFQPWQASYYPSNDFTGTPVTRVDEAISFDWTTGPPHYDIPADNFSVRWTGQFVAPRTGSYRFRANANESKKVWIDLNRNGTFEESEKLIDQSYGDHWSEPFDVTAGLSYDVKMDLIEYTGVTYAYLTAHESMTKLFSDVNDVVLFDLENDGDLDIAVAANDRDVVEIFRNESTPGAMAFIQLPTVVAGDSPRRMSVGDLNGDNFMDLVAANYNTNASTGRCVSVLLNDGEGGFVESKVGLTESPRIRPHGIALGDLDADGNLDMIGGDYDSTNQVAVWMGNGDGTFAAAVLYPYPTWYPADLTVGDYDQDGNLDVVVARSNYGQEISIYPGNGDGTLGDRVDVLTGFSCYPNFVKTTDLNADGYPDLLVGANYGLAVMTNDAAGGFGFRSARWNYGECYGITDGDFDSDGRVDILLADYDNDLLRFLRGNEQAPMEDDDSVTDVVHGHCRGALQTTSDTDYWKFTAEAGQVLTVAFDNTLLGGGDRRMRFYIYDAEGYQLFHMYMGNSGADENPPLVIPRDGTYYIRVYNYVGYTGEYRFRTTLSPAGRQVESEDNNSAGAANTVNFTLDPGGLTGQVFGYVAGYDSSGDYFSVGNLAPGTRLEVDLTKPTNSTLVSELRLYKSDGTEVVPDSFTATNLEYDLPVGGEATYVVRVTAASGAGLDAEYLLDFALTDTLPPSIVSDSFPAEGTTVSWVGPDFSVTFSEDMLESVVNDPATYELIASGGDGTFDDGNESAYTIAPNTYVSGLTAGYHLPDSPLQADDYRFTISTAMRDKLNNPIPSAYVRTWTVEEVSGYFLEGRDNDTFQTADTMSGNPMLDTFDGSFVNMNWNTTTADRPYSLEIEDFDGDGHLDVAVVYRGSGDGLRIFPGNGDGTFGTPQELPIVSDTFEIQQVDWDKDGDYDLLTVRDHWVDMFRNDSVPGTINFIPLAGMYGGETPRRMDVGYINGDTWPDVVISNASSNATTGMSVTLLINDQLGGFQAVRLGEDLDPRIYPHCVEMGDLNGDGKLDIAAADWGSTGQLVVWLGNGDGSFGAGAIYPYPVGWGPVDMEMADMNQDGALDVVTARAHGGGQEVSIYPGNGDGTLGDRVDVMMGFGASPNFIRVRDLNGDSWPDLLVGTSSGVAVMTNRAQGGLAFTSSRWSFGENYDMETGDLTEDGIPDLVILDYDEDLIRVLPGNPQSLLEEDSVIAGMHHGNGRGGLETTGDNDYYRFTASQGERLTVAFDSSVFGGGDRRMRFYVYDAQGNQLLHQYVAHNSSADENPPYVIPRDGTYYLRVLNYVGYLGEYRFRVTLTPPDVLVESENNNSRGEANAMSFELNGTQLEGRMFGYVGSYETSGDYFNLGNLAGDTAIDLTLALPVTSTLVPLIEVYDSAGTLQGASSAGDAGLSYTVPTGGDDTYYVRIQADSGAGIDAEYQLTARLTDLLPPIVTGSNLPSGSVSDLVDGFTLNFNKDMQPSSVMAGSNYLLVSAGDDDTFDTPDDVSYTVSPTSYSNGLSNAYGISDGPLAPGMYAFTADGLLDTFGNPLPLPFEQQFTISQMAGFQSESESNGTGATADVLEFTEDVPGLLTAAGRGRLAGSEYDYWQFEGEAGDVLVFDAHVPAAPTNQALQWYMTNPSGGQVFNRYQGHTNHIDTFGTVTLTETGTHLLRVDYSNALTTEYRFRVTLARGHDYESEDNGDIPNADALTFTTSDNIDAADVAGYLGRNAELDYFNLGTVATGSTVFLSVTLPGGSELVPVVALYNSSGVLMSETNGSAGDDNAEIQISTNDTYYALIRPNLSSAGIMSQYVLGVRVLPTDAVNFPNLRVTNVATPAVTGTESGDSITINFDVENVGNLGTGVAAWTDRVVLSANDVYGDLDDLQLALAVHNGALAAGGDYLAPVPVTIPQGLSGDFYVFVETDSSNAVDEILQESDNVARSASTFNIALADYPDLVVENLAITGPDGSGNYDIAWDLANRSSGTVPAGSLTNVRVINTTTAQVLLDVDVATTGVLTLDEVEAQSESVQTTTPGYYVVAVRADPDNDLYEYGATGHGAAEVNSVQDNFQIFRYFDITVAAQPVDGGNVSGGGNYREGETVTVTATPDTTTLPYAFINWTLNGAFVSSSATYEFIAGADRNLVAVFGLPQFQISGSVSPAASGTITGLGTYGLNAGATITAQPAQGYIFDRWEEGGATISNSAQLQFAVTGSRVLSAFFQEANPSHLVAFATDPPALPTIPGAGTYNNGDSINPTAPSPVEQGDFEYLFNHWELNGIHLGTNPTFAKTFSTLDPATMTYVAFYDERSLKPEMTSVVTNYGTLVPQANDVVFVVSFDRPMDTGIAPVLLLTSSNAADIPAMPAGGTWLSGTSFQSAPVTFGGQNGGAYTLNVTGGTDAAGRLMDPDASFGFTVDAVAPANPLIAEVSHTADSVTISWAAYSAPVDLSGFRYYIETTGYTDVSGLSAVGGGNAADRTTTFTGLVPDQQYHVSVTAVDVAGNSDPMVTPLVVELEAEIPPAVPIVLANTGLDSIRIDWSAYDTSTLIGLDGFRVFMEMAAFTDVTGLTPVADVEESVPQFDVTGLDRSQTYHIAVVGYNISDEFDPAVTPTQWSDPLAGSITTDMSIGGAGQTIDVLSSFSLDGGATLTIAPGTTLSFAAATGVSVNDGRILAPGTALEPIHFTSGLEFEEGMSPDRSDWTGIVLADGTNVTELAHVWLRYGDGLQVQAGTPVIDGVYAVLNSTGLAVSGSAVVDIDECFFVYNDIGLSAIGGSRLTIGASVIQSNTTWNLQQGGVATVNTIGNWWGTTSASAIAAKLDGIVTSGSPLAEEPVLGAAMATAGGETQTGSQTIDLRLMSVNGINGRLSEDSLFTGVLFDDLYDPDETFRISPYGFQIPFTLSSGGGMKSVFGQFRSATDETSSTLQLDIEYITDGPVITAFSLAEGQEINRPIDVYAAATAALGIKDLEFHADGVMLGRSPSSPLNLNWDPRSLPVGIIRVEALARDHAGNVATRAVNVSVNPTPPPAPSIASPTPGILTSASTIAVSGTAEPSVELRVSRNGLVVDTGEYADVNGNYSFAAVPVVEGPNSLVVSAFDAIGSASSAPITIFGDSGPPTAVTLLDPVYDPARRRVQFEWEYAPTGEEPTSFRILWKDTPFSTIGEADGQSNVVQGTSYTVSGLADGTYHFGVVGYDDAGNPSAISNLKVMMLDVSPPIMTVAYDQPLPVGPGNLGILLTTNEALQSPPVMTIRPHGSYQPINVTLSGGPLTFSATYPVTDLSAASGTAGVTVSATDQGGNRFTGTPQGPSLVFDITRPTGALSFDVVPPVQTTSSVTLSVGLTLSEPIAPGTTPTLDFDPPVGGAVPVFLSGSGTEWNGSVTLQPSMGKGNAFFLLSVDDQSGNTGTVLTSGDTIEIYNTADPDPPGIPTGLTGQILAGGEFRLQWNPVPRADSYKIYRESGDVGQPIVLLADEITETTFLDLPPADGFYRYAIVAELRGVQGPPSGVLIGYSDRTPPPVPENAAAQLLSSGVEITFDAPSVGEVPASYRIYRSDQLVRTVYSATTVQDNPPRGNYIYRVASADPYGNEAFSTELPISLLVSPVTNLQALIRDGQQNSLTWVSNDPTVVGYNVYRNGVKQNGAPLVNTFYLDPLATGAKPVDYSVAAVNADPVESPLRTLSVSPLSAEVGLNLGADGGEQTSVRGFFDVYTGTLSNLGTVGDVQIDEIELNRTVGATDALTQTEGVSLTMAPGASGTVTMVVPAPQVNAIAQTLQWFLRTPAADPTGSRVVYEFVTTKPAAVDSTSAFVLQPRDVPLAGGLTDFDLRLFNPGYAPIDILIGRQSGATPGDISLAVLDPSGVEVARTTFNGAGVSGATVDAQGNVFVTISPGADLSMTIPGVFIPESLAASGLGANFVLEIAEVRHGLGTGTGLTAGLVSHTISSSLTVTDYFGSAATDKGTYSDDEPIVITGQAIDRATGLPKPNAPLHIGFGSRGFVSYEDVTTDASGDYTLEYSPVVGFSGLLNVWAAHPEVVDQLNQVEVGYYRIYVTPQLGNIVMPKNDTLDVTLKFINPGNDLLATDITASTRVYIIEEGAEVDITTITAEVVDGEFSLNPLQDLRRIIRLTATLEAPDEALLETTFTSAEGAETTFVANVSLRPAIPVLSWVTPSQGYVDMSVDRGQIRSQNVTLENLGLRAVEGAEVIPPQNIPWMQVNLPQQEDGRIILPDIPVGGRITFGVAYGPPDGTDLGLYDDFLLVRGANQQSDFQVNLFAQVTSNQKGSVKFVVDNIFVESVPGAKIRLRNTSLREEVGPFVTDANGHVTVPDLQEGTWSWLITSSSHSSASGTVDVIPGQVVMVSQRLSKSLVTVDFQVVPKPFTDRYEIVIEQTFQTRVPFPVLVLDPPSFSFENLPDQYEATLLVTVKNEGLIRMFDGEVTGEITPFGSYEPMVKYIPVIEAQQEIVIPFKFIWNRNGLGTGDGSGATSSGIGKKLGDCASQVFAPPTIDKDFIYGVAALIQAAALCGDGEAALVACTSAVVLSFINYATSFFSGWGKLSEYLGCLAGSYLAQSSSGSPAPGSGGALGLGGGGCFPAGTMVTLADGSHVPIEALTQGQLVRTSGMNGQSGIVDDLIIRESGDLFNLTAEPVAGTGDAPESTSLRITGDHVVWSDRVGWKAARDLEIGEWIHHEGGAMMVVTRLEPEPGTKTVYTLEVKGNNAFYAGGLLVQDLCGIQKIGDRSKFTPKEEKK